MKSDVQPLRIPHRKVFLILDVAAFGGGTVVYGLDIFRPNPSLPVTVDLIMTVVCAGFLTLFVRALRTPLMTLDQQGMTVDTLFDRWAIRWSDIVAVRKYMVLWIRNVEVVPRLSPPRPWYQLAGQRRYVIPLWLLPMTPAQLIFEMGARAGANDF